MDNDHSPRYISRLTRHTVALVLAGGRGSRLCELTEWRAKPAVFFGGKYRIIDFTLSNCINSGIYRVGVLTQYKAHSLIRHLSQGWSFLSRALNQFVEVLPASQRRGDNWYVGTADAVYQNRDIIRTLNPKYVLILSGDHVYMMDYGRLLAFHEECQADMSVLCANVPLQEANRYGVVTVDSQHRIKSFREKPLNPQAKLGQPQQALASMGNYLFNTDFLFDVLDADAVNPQSSRDFGHDILPHIVDNSRVMAYPFSDFPQGGGYQPYWRDVGTLDAFWESNMEMLDVEPQLNVYNTYWPILTHHPQLPSAKLITLGPGREGRASNSIISGGCIISGAHAEHSMLFANVRMHSWSHASDSILFPQVSIGRYAKIRRAIIDRGCNIPQGMVIGENPDEDRMRFRVTSKGISLVTPGMLGQKAGSTI